MAKNSMKPQIRFKGFTDAWEQRKVNSICDRTYGGGTPSTSDSEFWMGDIPWIQSSDIVEHNVLDVVVRKRISSKAIRSSATQLVPANSIAIITRVGVGKLAFMPFSYTTSQDFLSLSNLRINTLFATYALYVKLQNDMNIVQGTSIKGITKEELLAKDIAVPLRTSEQEQISSLFRHIDNLITLHQRKYERFVNIKKALLEKMFPQGDERVPHIRFKGFTDAWEQRKVGELIEDYVEKTIIQNQYPVLTSSQQYGIVRQEEYFADRQVTTSDNIGYYVLPFGYFTYRSRSDTDLFVFNRNNLIDKGIISYYYPVFAPKDCDSNFLLRRLNYGIRHQLAMAAEGTGQKVLSHDKFKKMVLDVPSLQEQRQIGFIFEQIDNLITLHQRQVEKLKNIKSALLEKMFV